MKFLIYSNGYTKCEAIKESCNSCFENAQKIVISPKFDYVLVDGVRYNITQHIYSDVICQVKMLHKTGKTKSTFYITNYYENF